MDEHMANGDFTRWASRARDAANSVKELGKDMGDALKNGARNTANAAGEAITEVETNPGEAIKDAAAAVVEAAESGEIPPPQP